MDNPRPAEAFPVGEYLSDELRERGWAIVEFTRDSGLSRSRRLAEDPQMAAGRSPQLKGQGDRGGHGHLCRDLAGAARHLQTVGSESCP